MTLNLDCGHARSTTMIKLMPMPIPTIQNDHTAKFMRLPPSTCLVWMNDDDGIRRESLGSECWILGPAKARITHPTRPG
jgi:hypothetical protein